MPRTKQFDEVTVLSKATELFWKQGYHATSVQDLVDHLGINRASLYDTFGGKEALFQRAFAHYRDTNRARTVAFLRAQTSVREGVRQLLENAVAGTIADPEHKGCFVVNTTAALQPDDDRLREALAENRTFLTTLFRDYLREGEARGEIAPGQDLDALAALIVTLYHGIQLIGKVSPDGAALRAAVGAALTALR